QMELPIVEEPPPTIVIRRIKRDIEFMCNLLENIRLESIRDEKRYPQVQARFKRDVDCPAKGVSNARPKRQ
ncbi:MAG: hypothetical protein KJN62_08855, partial [Deltaproteobacteria bacterium]|nr:hypothetical protein [Deltaproteobacteria bacterium]